MLTALTSGLLLGLAAGLAPGPLMTLVITQSLRYGPREGCKIGLAPLLTDAPVIALALILASKAAEFRHALGILSIVGGMFVLYLAWETFRARAIEIDEVVSEPRSWLKGAITNLLNPHPWLFWMTVGAATLAQSLTEGWLAAVAFLAAFYLLLVGSKLLLALAAGRARDWMRGHAYPVAMKFLAGLLVLFSLMLLHEGWRHLA